MTAGLLTDLATPIQWPTRAGKAAERRGLNGGKKKRGTTRRTLAVLAALGGLPTLSIAQSGGTRTDITATSQFAGKPVRAVRIEGNRDTPTATVLSAVRTREGEPFDPLTVQEDYQRIFGLRRFADVTARIVPTGDGVIVVFSVVEQRKVDAVRFVGNTAFADAELRREIDVAPGESVSAYRIADARRAIEQLYRGKNFADAHVTVDQQAADREGVVTFRIVEGPRVYVRNINFFGAKSFDNGKLREQIQTKTWIPIFRDGTFNLSTIEDDVGLIKRYYDQNGFFDAKVGRRIVVSPDRSEVQVDFLVDEGPRYQINRITFTGNTSLTEAELRAVLKLREGFFFDAEVLRRDLRAVVRAYSPLGFIYDPESPDPDYLKITPRQVFALQPGVVELVYEISEGKRFRVGEILPRGNSRTQDKVVLRELRLGPGEPYNAAAIQDAEQRLRTGPYFSAAKITPVGTDPDTRDLLVNVTESQTASFVIGAGVNSNGGVGGNITYTQRNFDISNWPSGVDDVLENRAFVGAGQTFRASFEPGTTISNASVRFVEPWLFDQPYALSAEAYLRTRIREDYDDIRAGGRLGLTKRFSDVWSSTLSLRAERIDIGDIRDKPVRSFEILNAEGLHTLTSVGLSARRDTTNRGPLVYEGSVLSAGVEAVGALGGDLAFQRFNASYDGYFTIYEDLLDRKTVFALHGDAGYIANGAPFYERYYGGGIGSMRGFTFRGISPRDGPDDDRVGGEFSVFASAELSFPLYGESLRGVTFVDAGTVERDFEITKIRSAVGAGFRFVLPVFGQVPIALDFAFPMTKADEDDTQIISFSLGFIP